MENVLDGDMGIQLCPYRTLLLRYVYPHQPGSRHCTPPRLPGHTLCGFGSGRSCTTHQEPNRPGQVVPHHHVRPGNRALLPPIVSTRMAPLGLGDTSPDLSSGTDSKDNQPGSDHPHDLVEADLADRSRLGRTARRPVHILSRIQESSEPGHNRSSLGDPHVRSNSAAQQALEASLSPSHMGHASSQ